MLTIERPLTEDERICFVIEASWPPCKPLSTLDNRDLQTLSRSNMSITQGTLQTAFAKAIAYISMLAGQQDIVKRRCQRRSPW